MRIKRSCGRVLVVLLVAMQAAVFGDSMLKIVGELPELPEGIFAAGDIELRPDLSMAGVEIPGFAMSEYRTERVFRRKTNVAERISTLDKEGARKVADSFLNQYFPVISKSLRFGGCGISSRSLHGPGEEQKTVITGFTVRYAKEYRSIPILNDRLFVRIDGDEVVEVTVDIHEVREISKPAKLLTASECLTRASELLRKEFAASAIKRVVFGYRGNLRQRWQNNVEDWSKPFVAVPSYSFYIECGKGDFERLIVFDARTAELIYPREAKGKGEVEVRGPELMMTGETSKRVLLIGPGDVEIKRAVLWMENIPAACSWVTYPVKEVFSDTGEWGFANYEGAKGTYLVLNSNQDHSSKAKGAVNTETAGLYEVEVLVFQSERGDPGQAVTISINGQSRILGLQGPRTARVWEKWGTIELSKGRHEVTLGTGPGSVGYWEIGTIRMKRAGNSIEGICGVKDLQISLGRGRPVYRNAAPPMGRFESEDISSGLRSAFRYGKKGLGGERRMAWISVYSGSPGVLGIDSLRISFITGDEKLANRKAGEFVLIYPDGNSSRKLSDAEVDLFVRYVGGEMDSAKGRARNVCELLSLCRLGKQVCGKVGSKKARAFTVEFDRRIITLAKEEAERLVGQFQAYAEDWPRPADFPKQWGQALVRYRAGIDADRLREDGGYDDPWGNGYILSYSEGQKRVSIRTFGPNGRDDKGSGDDISATASLEWRPR